MTKKKNQIIHFGKLLTMSKKYVSELIAQDELLKWNRGDRILILAPTGSGKTQFVLGNLYKYCLEKKLKCLFLMNRILLKKQVENYIKEIDNYSEDILKIKLYQSIEANSVFDNDDATIQLEKYDIIVLDEAHHAPSDSEFSNRSDIVLKYVIRDKPNQILIFMSATPYVLLNAGVVRQTKKYIINKEYIDDIDKIYFYRKSSTLQKIINRIPKDEKILFFGAATDGLELHLQNKNESSFICAPTNNLKIFSSKDEMESIIKLERFSKRILFTTRVIQNGVTLKDRNLKHIIIDDSLDIITFIQMMGRKRILDESDKFTLYVKDHPNNVIQGKINISKLEIGEDVDWKILKTGYSKFLYEKWKQSLKNLDSGQELNIAKKMAKEFNLMILRLMLEHPNGFQDYICSVFNIPEHLRYGYKAFSMERTIAEEERKETPEQVLDFFYDQKLFKDNQLEFKKRFLDSLLSTERIEKVGLNALKGLIQDNKLPFILESELETHGDNKRKTYWIVKKIS